MNNQIETETKSMLKPFTTACDKLAELLSEALFEYETMPDGGRYYADLAILRGLDVKPSDWARGMAETIEALKRGR